MNEILLSLPAPIALPFRMKPVVENTALTGTYAASLLSIGNRLECYCQKANSSMSELAHFIVV